MVFGVSIEAFGSIYVASLSIIYPSKPNSTPVYFIVIGEVGPVLRSFNVVEAFGVK
ncbi:hypothetical protein JXI42_01590 [bacterium]|nr:hypothetical protein [bacterium]